MATREELKQVFANGQMATGEKFANLINSMKVVQLPVVDPQALGTSLSFIDSISQDEDGKITATKKTVMPTVGSFRFVANDATAEAALTTYGATYSSAISGVSPSADTTGVILLMNDDDTTPTKTMMIATQSDGNNGYQFVYVGDLDSALPADVINAIADVNVGSKATLALAIAAVPDALKKPGLTVMYYDTTASEWVAKRYIGTTTEGWSTESNWEDADGGVRTKSSVAGDFEIADENNNVIVRFERGHIRTKYFNSEDLPSSEENNINVLNEEESFFPFRITDLFGNDILRISDGYVITKNFDGKDIARKVGEFGPGLSDVDSRLRVIEMGSLEPESIIQAALTRAASLFAPIGQADVSYTPKRSIKILFIGNSVTQDHLGYLPWMLRQLYRDDIDFVIGNYYQAGATITRYTVGDEHSPTPLIDYTGENLPGGAVSSTFSIANNSEVWTQYSNKTVEFAVLSQNWDVVSIQAYPYGLTAEEEALNAPTLVDWIRSKNQSPFELAFLMHQCFKTSELQQRVRDAARLIIKQNPVTMLFAPYFCMKEAQKYWSVNGVLSPEGDGTHLREGLPVMITGLHIMQVICNKFGIINKVLKNGLMMTTAIWNTLNVPGPNGTVDDTLATLANYQKVQNCAIQGTKEGEAYYNQIISEQLSDLLS